MGNSEASAINYKLFLDKFSPVSKVLDENYGEGSILLEKEKKREVFLKEEIALSSEEYKKKLVLLKNKQFHPNIVAILGNFKGGEVFKVNSKEKRGFLGFLRKKNIEFENFFSLFLKKTGLFHQRKT